MGILDRTNSTVAEGTDRLSIDALTALVDEVNESNYTANEAKTMLTLTTTEATEIGTIVGKIPGTYSVSFVKNTLILLEQGIITTTAAKTRLQL